MDLYRKIPFRILFLLAILLSFGSDTYSNYTLHSCVSALSPDAGCEGYGIVSDIDSPVDDQIIHHDKHISSSGHKSKMTVPRNRSMIHEYCQFIWQPPKIS
jgi:hypothetical protein